MVTKYVPMFKTVKMDTLDDGTKRSLTVDGIELNIINNQNKTFKEAKCQVIMKYGDKKTDELLYQGMFNVDYNYVKNKWNIEGFSNSTNKWEDMAIIHLKTWDREFKRSFNKHMNNFKEELLKD